MQKKVFSLILILAILILVGTGLIIDLVFKHARGRNKSIQNTKAPETQITLIEGWTNDNIINYLEKQDLATSTDFITAESKFSATDYPILSSKPTSTDLEGFIFPDTYKILKYTPAEPEQTAKDIIKKALDNFTQKFTPDMLAQAQKDNMSIFQILTLASIIEKETGREATTPQARQSLQDERNTIAGIFYNRLKIGQPLQSDATINFITQKNDRQATNADTQIDSPYNTYKYPGLPPGPICNPSLSSITAALYPTSNPYYYFLHKPDGEPVYSKTYDEHEKNKLKYLN